MVFSLWLFNDSPLGQNQMYPIYANEMGNKEIFLISPNLDRAAMRLYFIDQTFAAEQNIPRTERA